MPNVTYKCKCVNFAKNETCQNVNAPKNKHAKIPQSIACVHELTCLTERMEETEKRNHSPRIQRNTKKEKRKALPRASHGLAPPSTAVGATQG